MGTRHRIEVVVNGRLRVCETAGRTSLADLLRDDLGLTGTHLGCEHGVCGCCTVLFDGEPVRSCIILAAQADGHQVTTIEGVGEGWAAGAARQGWATERRRPRGRALKGPAAEPG